MRIFGATFAAPAFARQKNKTNCSMEPMLTAKEIFALLQSLVLEQDFCGEERRFCFFLCGGGYIQQGRKRTCWGKWPRLVFPSQLAPQGQAKDV
jgi:hypothetical protein